MRTDLLDPAHIFEKLHPQTPQRTAFALNKIQREAIKERDGQRCQGCGITKICNRSEPECNPEKLQVHHILPQGYAKKFDIDPDYPENLITVCTTLHTGHPTQSIHPDTFQAKMTYQGQHKDAFKEMKEKREEMLAQRQVYWNTAYDRPLQALAVKNTQQALGKGWEFPFRKDQVYAKDKEVKLPLLSAILDR